MPPKRRKVKSPEPCLALVVYDPGVCPQLPLDILEHMFNVIAGRSQWLDSFSRNVSDVLRAKLSITSSQMREFCEARVFFKRTIRMRNLLQLDPQLQRKHTHVDIVDPLELHSYEHVRILTLSFFGYDASLFECLPQVVFKNAVHVTFEMHVDIFNAIMVMAKFPSAQAVVLAILRSKTCEHINQETFQQALPIADDFFTRSNAQDVPIPACVTKRVRRAVGASAWTILEGINHGYTEPRFLFLSILEISSYSPKLALNGRDFPCLRVLAVYSRRIEFIGIFAELRRFKTNDFNEHLTISTVSGANFPRLEEIDAITATKSGELVIDRCPELRVVKYRHGQRLILLGEYRNSLAITMDHVYTWDTLTECRDIKIFKISVPYFTRWDQMVQLLPSNLRKLHVSNKRSHDDCSAPGVLSLLAKHIEVTHLRLYLKKAKLNGLDRSIEVTPFRRLKVLWVDMFATLQYLTPFQFPELEVLITEEFGCLSLRTGFPKLKKIYYAAKINQGMSDDEVDRAWAGVELIEVKMPSKSYFKYLFHEVL